MNIIALPLPPRSQNDAELCVERILARLDVMLKKVDDLILTKGNNREYRQLPVQS